MAGDQYGREKRRRWLAGFLAVIMTITEWGFHSRSVRGIGCVAAEIDGPVLLPRWGKRLEEVDRYDMYKFDTMPSPLTETQAKRLFWAYPDNWSH